tara:strand:- start:4860 stop:5690 length:831 start_codon:yes stop_codon:yes gene_type:complete
MNAYLLSHNGLGDNLYMIGAVRFLLQYYKNIYFLCKDIYYDNVKLFYKNNNNVILIPINSKKEISSCKEIINKSVYLENDVLISGSCHKCFLESKITNKKLLQRIPEKKRYTIVYDTLDISSYGFIENFYLDINLDLNIFFECFDLPLTMESQSYYNSLAKYDKIIFIHSKASNKRLIFDKLYKENVMETNTIMVCADHNVYTSTRELNKNQTEKFDVCNDMVNIPLIYYLDIIKNCNEIYIIDSCFTGIVLPLLKTQRLKATEVRIIERNKNIIL